MHRLTVIQTHPIQYYAPLYRCLQQEFDIPTTVIYGCDFSIARYYDSGFSKKVSWDTDLLKGYESRFLIKTSDKNKIFSDQAYRKRLKIILEELLPSVVLVSGYNTALYRESIYQVIKMKVPIIFRAETTDHGVRRSIIKKQIRDIALRWFYSKCSKILYIGEKYSYEHFMRLGVKRDKLIFSPYCVDDNIFKSSHNSDERLRLNTRGALGVDLNTILILFSGKLIKRKAPDILLQAICKLSSLTKHKIALIFMGEGEMRRSLEKDSKNKDFQIIFTGFKNQSEIHSYYCAADIFVLPSIYETWGLVVNEALHHGLPCVTTKGVGCSPDLIEEGLTGEICAPNSITSLAEAIERAILLARNSETKKRCLKKIKKYSINKAAEGIAQAYSAVISKKQYIN